jgi:hypothetical protein
LVRYTEESTSRPFRSTVSDTRTKERSIACGAPFNTTKKNLHSRALGCTITIRLFENAWELGRRLSPSTWSRHHRARRWNAFLRSQSRDREPFARSDKCWFARLDGRPLNIETGHEGSHGSTVGWGRDATRTWL